MELSRIAACAFLALQTPNSTVRAATDEVITGWQWHLVPNREGVPPMIRAIVQTPDGYLWLGTYYGVYRFDGFHLDAVGPSSEKPLQSNGVDSLIATTNGTLWVGHDWGGLSVIRRGAHTMVTKPYLATIPLMRTNASGAVWALAVNGKGITLARLIDGRWVIWAQMPMGFIMNGTVGNDGSLWFTVGDQLFMASPEKHEIASVMRVPATGAALSADANGEPWLITRDRLLRLKPGISSNGLAKLSIAKPAAIKVGAAAFDGTRDIWVIEQDTLLRRYHIGEDGHTLSMTGSWRSPYQLSSTNVALSQAPMFVDREHNLWIGTSQGLLRFSHAAFTLVSKAVAPANNGSLPYGALTDGRGDVWQWRKGRLYAMARDGSMVAHPEATSGIDFAPCPGAQGGVWMPRDRNTIALFGGPSRRVIRLEGKKPLADLAQGDCAEDSKGRLWADGFEGLVLLGPGSRHKIPLGEDSGYQVQSMVSLGAGQIAAYVGHGSLWRTDGIHAEKLWDEKAITLGFIEVMIRSGTGLLLGGDRGIARFDGHRFSTLSSQRFPFLTATTGIAQTPQGETWLQSSHGVIRLRTADLDRAFADPTFHLKPQIFSMNDGLPGTPSLFNLTNVNADRDGHIWVTTENGIARHDLGQQWNLTPPPVVITGISADGDHFAASPKLTLPPGTGRIRIDFTALSYADPTRQRFRYRLLGIDSDWVDPGEERSASYTRLSPGTYNFQVIAANNEGVWNRQGATITLIEPALFYQTWWFRGVLAAIAALAAWALYRWRVGIVARQLREHAAQRAHERERVARDIHDTLLQSIQGLVLRFQSVAGKMARTDPHRALLETTLDRADDLIAQGKERVHGLRDDDRPLSLPALIREQLDEAPFSLDIERELALSGSPVEVTTVVALEVREIVGEALFNAARHSKAAKVSIELSYGASALYVTISDNGVGIDADTASGTGGYGLVGMRGRAESVGGRLTIARGLGGGTRIELRIPARRAYVYQSSWWRRSIGR